MKRRTPPQVAAGEARRRAAGASAGTAAAQSAAAERARIRRMSALERALLALDLGERFGTFAKPDPILEVCRRYRLGRRLETLRVSKKRR